MLKSTTFISIAHLEYSTTKLAANSTKYSFFQKIKEYLIVLVSSALTPAFI